MQKRNRAGRRIIVLAALFIFSSVTLFSGLFACLTKTSQSKADYYMAAANNYIQKSEHHLLATESSDYLLQQSHAMLIKAAQQTPYDPRVWEKISVILSRKGEYKRAHQAGKIMSLLGHTGTHNDTEDFLPVKPLVLSESLVIATKVR